MSKAGSVATGRDWVCRESTRHVFQLNCSFPRLQTRVPVQSYDDNVNHGQRKKGIKD